MDLLKSYLRDSQSFYPDRFLVETYLRKGMNDQSDFAKFEDNLGLDPLPRQPVHTQIIYRKTDAEEAGVVPIGNTLWQQVSSLLPTSFFVGRDFPGRISKEVGSGDFHHPETVLQELGLYVNSLSTDRVEYVRAIKDSNKYHPLIRKEVMTELQIRYSLAYVMSRHIVGYLPRTASWVDEIEVLDPFTAALFSLLVLTRGSMKKLRWITALHNPRNLALSLTSISPTIPRFEGASLYPRRKSHREVLQRLAASTCLLNREMLAVTQSMSDLEPQPQVTSKIVRQALSISNRSARYKGRIFERGLEEHFIANLRLANFRYRYIFITDSYLEPLSDSIVEKRTLLDGDYAAVETHIEPMNTSGPRIARRIAYDIAAEHETVSFRVDLFNPETNEWKVEPWEYECEEKPAQHDGWLYAESKRSGDMGSLTPSQLELIMILLANEGGPQDRYSLLNMMGYPLSTARQNLQILLSEQVLSVLYHPQPSYNALPDEILLVFKDCSPENIDDVCDWLNCRMPYVHTRLSHSGRNGVIHIRLPLHTVGVVKGIIESRLEDMDILVSLVKEKKNFFLTVFNKSFNYKNNSFKNPWDWV